MTPRRTRTIALLLAAALALPAAGAAVLSFSLSDRDDRLDRVPVAIVNDDEIVTGDEPMAAGRALSAALVHPDDAHTLGWTVTSEADAAAGLADGDYYAVLTIPEDFSASVLSAGSDDPRIAELTLETNPASSATAALAATVVAETAAATLGESVTDAVLTTTLTGVSTLSESLGGAADAAGQLADGADGLADGTAQLDSGAGALASGVGTLADGTAQLAAGAEELADAAAAVADGADALASGAADLATGAAGVDSGSTGVATGARGLADSLTSLAAACPVSGAAAPYCANLAQAADAAHALAGTAGQVASGAADVASGASALSEAAVSLETGTAGVAAGAAGLADGVGQTADGAVSAAAGAADLAAGTAELADGAASYADGSREYADGLAEGAAQAPTYSEDEVDAIAAVAAQPVAVSTDAASSAAGWLAASVAVVVLWFASLATLVWGRGAFSPAALDSPASNARLAAALLRPRLAIAVAHGVLTTAVIALFGFDLRLALAFGAASVLAALSFASLVTGLQALLRGWGLAAFGVLTALQLAAVSGIVPIETAPDALGSVSGLLPANAFATAAAQLAGDPTGQGIAGPLAVLVVWTLVGAGLTVLGIRRRRASDRAFPAAARPSVRGRMAA